MRGAVGAKQHTIGHIDCPACKGLTVSIQQFGDRGRTQFPVAVRDYLELRRGKLGERSFRLYEKYAEALDDFFHEFTLEQIEIGHVVAYQRERQKQIRESKQHQYAKQKLGAAADGATDGASIINHEISCVLRQVLRLAGLWTPIERFYEPLPLPRIGPGIALTADEESHLFAVAATRPRWMVALCCSLISRNTTAGPSEIRYLRMRNVDLDGRRIYVEQGTKNDFRMRALPLNDDALAAAMWLVDRYRRQILDAGLIEHPDHFVIPHRAPKKGQTLDAFRPIGSWKKAFYALRAEAGKKFPRLLTVRRYDFRHTACTNLLEDSTVSYGTIEKLMGHRIGSKTKQKYDHIRDSTLRVAVDALSSGHTRSTTLEVFLQTSARKTTAPAPEMIVQAPRKGVQKSISALAGTVSFMRKF
jgi:integrase